MPGLVRRVLQPDRHERRHSGVGHRYAHEIHGVLHGPLVVGDDDELGVVDGSLEQLEEALRIGLVEGSVDLVEEAERR